MDKINVVQDDLNLTKKYLCLYRKFNNDNY